MSRVFFVSLPNWAFEQSYSAKKEEFEEVSEIIGRWMMAEFFQNLISFSEDEESSRLKIMLSESAMMTSCCEALRREKSFV